VKRFVVISEILGYTLSAAVGLGVLYSVFVEVEILARVKGELRPSCMEIKVDADVLLIEYLAASGEDVAKGQPVLRVVVDEASRRRMLVRHRLEATVAALESDSSGESQAALEDARRALAVLPPVEEKVETLTTPCDGVFRQLADIRENNVVPAGKALALVYDMSELLLDISPGASLVDSRVADGQEARATIPEAQERLIGHVVTATITDTSNGFSIRFQGVPQADRDHMFTLLFGENKGVLGSVDAEVVVGHQSLFRKTFGRRQ
jgi:hypothetical protein